jgi:hypothetical protein
MPIAAVLMVEGLHVPFMAGALEEVKGSTGATEPTQSGPI